MKTHSLPACLAAIVAALTLVGSTAHALTPAVEIASGLQYPYGVTISAKGDPIVSESGPGSPNTGRISIIDQGGSRRTLLDGLPSGIADVGDPSGPAGMFIRGHTLFVSIMVGDVAVPSGIPGQIIANPNPVSSPLFSSVLAIHFNGAIERSKGGFSLTLAKQNELAAGAKVKLTNAAGEKITLERVVDFANSTPNPTAAVPAGIRISNPFNLVVVDDFMYVTDGGQNLVRKIDLGTGTQSVLATFPNIPNPLFGIVGGPFSEAVPTGIRIDDDVLLVTLFRGVPFAPGTSTVVALDPETGAYTPFIDGLKTAIDVLPVPERIDVSDYLVLQHASAGPFFASPGQLLGFDAAGGSKTLLVDGMTRPTSMALDARSGILYVTEFGGRVLAIPFEMDSDCPRRHHRKHH